jgi:signal transduction histidine kinase
VTRFGAVRSLHPTAADALFAAVVVPWLAFVATQIEPTAENRAVDVVGWACIVVAGGALALRRRQPLAVVAVVTTALAVFLGRGYPGGPVYLTLFVAIYSLAGAVDRRVAFTVAAAASSVLVVTGVVTDRGPGLAHLVFVGWTAAAVFLGDAVRSRRQSVAALEERARHLQQSRDEETRRRVAEERLRIARDLHDSVAHTMATINVQAGAAAHVIDRHPEQAKEALHVVQQASREVLEELNALLGLLRVDAGEQADRAPTPGLDQLEQLAESTRRAGLEIAVDVRRDVTGLPHAVTVAAYRIVQESLTNVVRHAGSRAAATVVVGDDGDGGLRVEILDDGTGVAGGDGAGGGAGVGLVGMRERAESTGGTLEAGARREGGFAVRATWPATAARGRR